MRRKPVVLLLAGLLALTAQAQQSGGPGAPPVAAAGGDAEALFGQTCGRCHRAGGMGTGILSRRPGMADGGLLEKREDLTASFVKAVARVGTGNMPRISRAEVSDKQLEKIAGYLAKGKP